MFKEYVFSLIPAVCFGVLERVSNSRAVDPGWVTSDFSYGWDWFSGLHVAVFRLVFTSDSWEQSWAAVEVR